ncbi:MAG: hypothetical protein OMM_13984, partial [Candidatus Magnetoglobus multicellularis str. Araruama]
AGQLANMLEISVDTISADVGTGGLYINESDGIIIDTVPEISVNRIKNDLTIDLENSPTDSSQSNIVSTGDVEIIAETGDITVNTITATGYVNIAANTNTSNININTITSENYVNIISTASTGNITIHTIDATGYVITNSSAEGDILINLIESDDDVTITASNGSILENLVDDEHDIIAGIDKTITLTASNHIAGTNDFNDENAYFELATNTILNASSTVQGNIYIKGTGKLILNDIDTTDGKIDILAPDQLTALDIQSGGENGSITLHNTSGDILIGAIISSEKINMTSDQGAIIDHTDDTIIDLTANDLITLIANTHIHATGETDTFLEFANNSLIDAKTLTEGNIHIQGEGGLTLQN